MVAMTVVVPTSMHMSVLVCMNVTVCMTMPMPVPMRVPVRVRVQVTWAMAVVMVMMRVTAGATATGVRAPSLTRVAATRWPVHRWFRPASGLRARGGCGTARFARAAAALPRP